MLWSRVAPGGVLLLVDRGTPWGFHVIRAARDGLLQAHREVEAGSSGDEAASDAEAEEETGIAVVAPCPHAQRCPMHAKSWCHFSQTAYAHPAGRRKRVQRGGPDAALPLTRDKYSYVALRRVTEAQSKEHPPPQRVPLRSREGDPDSDDELWFGPPPDAGAPRGGSGGDAQAAARALQWMRRHAAGEAATDTSPPAGDEAAAHESEDDDEAASLREELLRDAIEEAARAGVAGAGTWARIVRAPMRAGKHVTLDLCTPRGTLERR